MPDLSVLVQLAEYYDVEMRELLDGERSQTMNKDMKETLDKVAVYEEWVKQFLILKNAADLQNFMA